MERTDIYFAKNYMVRAFAYCVQYCKNSMSRIVSVVADVDSTRVSIYGHIHGEHLNRALDYLARTRGYKPIDITTITI